MSPTSYQTALPRNRGEAVYTYTKKWSIETTLEEGFKWSIQPSVKSLQQHAGWMFLILGLLITSVSIVIPTLTELADLKSQVDKSQIQLAEKQGAAQAYLSFYDEVIEGDSVVQERVRQLQFNQSPVGSAIVYDSGASSTPLQWIDEKVSSTSSFDETEPEQSLLSQLLAGVGQLWCAAIGVFLIFLGCVQ